VKKYFYSNASLPLYSLDAGIIDTRLDSIVDLPNYMPPGPSYIRHVSYAVFSTVKNFGTDLLDTLVVSAKSDHSATGYCYMPYVCDTFYNLNIVSGASAELYLGRMHFYEVISGESLNVCAYSDMPSFKIDHLGSNNAYCKSTSYVDIEEVESSYQFNVYPNPAFVSEGFYLDVGSDNTSGMLSYLVRDISGRIMYEAKIREDKTSVLINGISAGIYFIELIERGKTHGFKKVVLK
jgi:Secretion system C-terminal sorting domain